MPCAQPRDRREHAVAASKAFFGLATQPRPGVGAGSRAGARASSRADRNQVRIERAASGARQASIGAPDASERHDELTPGAAAHEFNRVMPLAEPDPHTVSELPLERLAPRAIEADRADRALHRNPASFVERRQVRHEPSVPGSRTRVCAAPSRVGADLPIDTRCGCQLTALMSPTPRILNHINGAAPRLGCAGAELPNDTRRRCQLTSLPQPPHGTTTRRPSMWGPP